MGELRAILELGSLASRTGIADLGKVAATGGWDAFRSGGIKAAEAVEGRIIGAKNAETIAMEEAAGTRAAESAATNEAANASKGSLIGRMVKRVFGTGAAGAMGYGASRLGSALGSLGQGANGTGAAGSPDEVIANPGAVSPAGEVKVPDIGIAPELAAMQSAGENIEGGSSSASSGNHSNDPEIVRILKQILEQEKTNTARMSQGFAEMARMQANFIRSSVSARQAEAIEATSSGGINSIDRGSGSLFSSALGTLGSSMKAIAGGIGIAALAGVATTMARDAVNPGESSTQKAKQAAKEAEPATANNGKGKSAQMSLEQEYKGKYGNDWPEKLVEAIFNRMKSDPGFQRTEKTDKSDAAYLLYTQIKEIYDKANDKEKRELEASIGKEVGVNANQVRKKIDVYEGAVGTAAAASTGVALAVNLGGAKTVGSLGKAATLVGGGLINVGAYIARSVGAGDTADKMESYSNKMVDNNMGSIGDWEKDRVAAAKKVITPVEQALMANHPTATTVGSVGTSLLTGSGTGSEAREAPKSAAAEINNDMANSEPLSEKQRQAIEYFTSNGWTQAQAEGIVANLTAESNLKTNAVGDKKGGVYEAYGIAQWHPDRQKMFEKIIGKPIRGSSLEDQLKFVNWELNNSHKSAGDHLRKTTDARDAAVSVVQRYEVSAQRFGADATKRGDIAESLASSYGSNVSANQIAPSVSAANGQASPHVADMPAAMSPPVAQTGNGNVNTSVTNDNRRTTVSHTTVNAGSAAMPSNLAPHVT